MRPCYSIDVRATVRRKEFVDLLFIHDEYVCEVLESGKVEPTRVSDVYACSAEVGSCKERLLLGWAIKALK